MSDSWQHRSENMKCQTCMWFVPKIPMAPSLGEDESIEDLDKLKPGPIVYKEVNAPFKKIQLVGRCRRHAPTMSGYPVVFSTDWCGDHKLDEGK